jgi:SAM-dependent methyltransferase
MDSGIADLGCGAGTLLDGFRQAGYSHLMGLDPAPDAASRARDILGLGEVKTGYFHQASDLLPIANVGLVCLTGVLEHLPEARDEMANLLAQLPPDTLVLVEVPALERFSGPNKEPFGEFSLEHIQYFSQASLIRFMASHGFSPVTMKIVDLVGATDSLFGLFSRSNATPPSDDQGQESPAPMDTYLAQSRQSLNEALARISSQVSGPFLIYGAGSHTVRLLPELTEMGLLNDIRGIVDGNPNLQGKHLASQEILPPSRLTQFHGMPILVSSYKAQDAIARTLANQHPLILMY